MASRSTKKLVFPADIHHIAADIRRQALQHPDRDPVVPGAPRATKRTAAKRTTVKRKTATKAKRRARRS